MAGHSQFKNIMHRKGAQDAKRAKLFTKILREVTVAAKAGGTDPSSNPRLRNALLQARQANLPKDNLDRAVAKAHESTENYESLYYEAMGPGQAAFLVQVLTDNRNRSAAEVRATFNKNGSRAADVTFLFDHVGVITYTNIDNPEKFMDTAIEGGASDIQEHTHEEGTEYTVICPRDSFFALKDHLEKDIGAPISASLEWIAKTPYMPEDDGQKKSIQKIIDTLEDMDDVQNIWTNATFD